MVVYFPLEYLFITLALPPSSVLTLFLIHSVERLYHNKP